MVKTQWGSRRKVTNTHNYWQAFRGAAETKLFTLKFAGLPPLPTFSSLIAYLRNQASKAQSVNSFASSFNSSFSILNVTNTVCVIGSHSAAAGDGFSVQSLGSSWCCLATLRLPVLEHHHTNEKASFLEQKSRFYTSAKFALSCQL